MGCFSTAGGGRGGSVVRALIDFFGFGVEEFRIDCFLEGEWVGVEVGVEMGVHPAEYICLIFLTTVVVVSSLVKSPK